MIVTTKILLFYAVALVLVAIFFLLVYIFGDNYRKANQAVEIGETGSFLKNSPTVSDLEDYLAVVSSASKKKRPPAVPVGTAFLDIFSSDARLEETGTMYDTGSLNWWVNSGAWLFSSLGTGKTIQGDLSISDKWYAEYLKSNPIDTDNGLHPQNIFRLVQTGKWKNLIQEVYFRINKLNISTSPNRNASNGLLLFNRYQTGDNLYYTGIRVDGTAVIKKKINGAYYTLAYNPMYNTAAPYNRDTNPNLIPSQQWIGFRSERRARTDNTVSIKLFIDKDKAGNWVLVAEAQDDGKSYGGTALLNEGYAGIRTDFMDVEFDDYRIASF